MPPLRSPKPNKNTADYVNRRTELQQQQKKGENRKTETTLPTLLNTRGHLSTVSFLKVLM